MRKQYLIRATREGDWWFLEVDGVPGGYSQARRLDQVEATVRDLLSTLLEVPPDSLDLDTRVEWPAELRVASAHAGDARRSAEEAKERAATEMRDVAAAAARAGFTVRDVAALLGISPQRVSQLKAPRTSATLAAPTRSSSFPQTKRRTSPRRTKTTDAKPRDLPRVRRRLTEPVS